MAHTHCKAPAATASFHSSGAGGQISPSPSQRSARHLGRVGDSLLSTLHCLLKNGQLPDFKIGSDDWRFNVETIDQWRIRSSAGSARGITPERCGECPLSNSEGFASQDIAVDL